MSNIVIDPKIELYSTDELWNKYYCKERIVKKVNFSCHLNEKTNDSIRIVCISDTHNKLSEITHLIPPGDILIHAGDFTNFGSIEEIDKFNDDLKNLPHTYKIVIAGNHELGFEDNEDESLREKIYLNKGTKKGYERLKNCIYLQDNIIELFGIKIYGTSWHPLPGYSFSVPRGKSIAKKWSMVPDNIDILVTHTPPLGHNDTFKDGTKWGCGDLLNAVEKRIKPKVHIFGHVHENNGITSNNETYFINASICSHQLESVNKPIIFDWNLEEHSVCQKHVELK